MIFFNKHLAASWAFSVQLRKAFIQPEKVQTNTRKYRGLFLAHRLRLSHTLTYTGELGDIKMLGQCGPESSLP
jgi:hypothetical protein